MVLAAGQGDSPQAKMAHTVPSPEDIDDELRNLMLVVAQ
jgi:hypothetical protein